MATPIVVYIAGAGRSGTTLLSRILGEINGWFSAGELNYFWAVGHRKNTLCSCGQPILQCEFWAQVLNKYMARNPDSQPAYLEEAIARRKYLPQILLPLLASSQFKRNKSAYIEVLREFYWAIAEIANAGVIVDSSKDPGYALLLKEAGFDVKIVHLVRDVRAVAYSRRRKKRRTHLRDEIAYMPVQSMPEVLAKWWGVNILSEVLKFYDLPYHRIRYEDLADSPLETIRSLTQFVGQNGVSLDFIRDRQIFVRVQHLALGNPGRFTQPKDVFIRPDVEWREGMPGWRQTVLGILAMPLLKRYR